MKSTKSHKTCKLYGYKKCPQRKSEIMQKALQDTPEFHGVTVHTLSFPLSDEVDSICSTCESYISQK